MKNEEIQELIKKTLENFENTDGQIKEMSNDAKIILAHILVGAGVVISKRIIKEIKNDIENNNANID